MHTSGKVFHTPNIDRFFTPETGLGRVIAAITPAVVVAGCFFTVDGTGCHIWALRGLLKHCLSFTERSLLGPKYLLQGSKSAGCLILIL